MNGETPDVVGLCRCPIRRSVFTEVRSFSLRGIDVLSTVRYQRDAKRSIADQGHPGLIRCAFCLEPCSTALRQRQLLPQQALRRLQLFSCPSLPFHGCSALRTCKTLKTPIEEASLDLFWCRPEATTAFRAFQVVRLFHLRQSSPEVILARSINQFGESFNSGRAANK
jgi:hypothetical protein